MFKMFYALTRLCIIVHLTAHFVWSDEAAIYVSRSHGNDSTTCGKQLSPCRTISCAIHQVSDGAYIYLDGTDTSKNPYTCEPLYPGDQGIHLTKSVSFEGMKSRAYISCLHGNQWLVNGIQHNGLRVSFYGLAFQNTSLRFYDASVYINDCLFKDSEHVTMNFTVSNLVRFDLALNNSVFQQNVACMAVESDSKMKMYIHITDSTFIQNGNSDSSVPSILWLSSGEDDISIQMSNCSFQKNTFEKNGMILVENGQGTTNVSLHQFKFEENGHSSTIHGIPDGVFFLISARVIMNLEFGFVYSTYGTFLTVNGQSAQIYVSNTEVDGFYSPDEGGGVVDIYQSTSSFLSIKDCSFRNGKSSWFGGVVAMIAPISILTIQNSTFHNISNPEYGGAVYVQSHDVLKSGNHSKYFVLELNIIDSSFSDSSSGDGGAVLVFADNLFATVNHSLFERNSVKRSGGALQFDIHGTAIIHFHSVYFFKNFARYGGILTSVLAKSPFMESTFEFTTNNVSFVMNEVRTQQPEYGILHLWTDMNILSVVLKSTRFISNIAVHSSAIVLRVNNLTTFHSITLDTCIFRKNVVNNGVLRVKGQAILICKHSIFDSNGYFPCLGAAFGVSMNDSKITITNTTFVNNSCGAVAMYLRPSKTSWLKIEDSVFVRNRIVGGSGSAIATRFISTDSLSQTHKRSGNWHHTNILIQNVLFQENIASSCSALTVDNGNTKILNCTFVDNFSRFQGGQICSFGSADMNVFHSVFKQTLQKIFSNGTEFVASSFLRIHSSGQLLLRNTTINSNTVPDAPLILASKARQVEIDKSSMTTCPVGFGITISIYTYKDSNDRFVTVLGLSCSECDYNYYSIQRGHVKGLDVNHIFQCTPCPRGADCLSNIRSKPNFWGYHASLNPPILAFTLCPFGYCKSPRHNRHKYNDCQGKRTGVMCGMCSDGYTEALWSTYCTSIEDCNDQWFWIVLLALVFSMAILVFNPPFIKYAVKHVLWFLKLFTCICNRSANQQQLESIDYNVIRSLSLTDEGTGQENIPRSSKQQQRHEKRQFYRFLEIIFYFYQIALQLLLSSYSLSEFFDTKFIPPVLSFFNFEPSFNKRVCPFPGLTPKTKLLFKIVPVFGTILAIFTIYFLKLFICKLRGTLRPSISPYLQATFKTIFLGYVTLAIVSISLIRCVSVAGETRWFYNGNIRCYQWWQYAAFVFNGIFVIPFIFVLAWASFKIHHNTITTRQFILAITFPLPFLLLWLFRVVYSPQVVNVEESQNLSTLKEMLLGPYKKPGDGSKYGALYWQSVHIARRFILVLIFCTVTEPSVRLFCMTLACVCVLSCHLVVKPFQNSLANNLESISLLLLVILGLINLFKSVFLGNEGDIKGSLVTVFKVFHWLEIVILGLFPALLSLLACFAMISLIVRVLFVCCRSLFKCLSRRCIQRSSHNPSRLLDICEE